MAWGPPGLFLIAFIDSSGIPIPQGVDALVLLLAAKNPGQAYLYATLAVVGSTLGCLVLYWLARTGGHAYLDRIARPERVQRFRAWFAHYGLVTTFIPTLVPVIPLPTKVFIALAGALEARPLPFVLVVVGARTLRYFGEAYLGAQMGEHSWTWLGQHGRELGLFAVALALLLLILIRIGDRHAPASTST